MTHASRFPATVLCALLALPATALAQETTSSVRGELAACYVGQDLSNEDHLACANLCMELAVPMVLVARDGHVYVPTGSDSKQLSKHANDLIEIRGTVGERAECRTIAVKSIERTADEDATRSRAFGSTHITAEDLENLRPMTLYEFFRQHSRVRFDRGPAGNEILLCEDRGGVTDMRGCAVVLEGRLIASGPIALLRSTYIHEVERLEILRRSEASNRFGGDGWSGAIVVHMKS